MANTVAWNELPDRHDPLTATCITLLTEQKRAQNYERLQAIQWQNHGFVFAQHDGRPLSPQVVSLYFKRVLRESPGLRTDYRVCDLRHSMATLLGEGGANPRLVTDRLGHSSINTTLQIYRHTTESMREEPTRMLEKLLFGEPGTR